MRNQSGIGLGDFVVTTPHGHRGRVYEIHLMGCPFDMSWFRAQRPPLDEALYMGVWLGILVHEGGAVCVPVDAAELIETFTLINRDVREYWPRE